MMILSYLSFDFPTLNLQDSVQKALTILSKSKKNALAVLDGKKFCGNIDETTLVKFNYPNAKLKDLKEEFSTWKMESEEDLLATIPVFEKSQLQLLAVVNENNQWQGYLEINQLYQEIFQTSFNTDKGGVIRIPFHIQRDSFGQIARIIEENKGLIVRSYLKAKDKSIPELVLQVQTNQFPVLIQSLERHGFMIEKAFMFGSQHAEADTQRFDLLMKYLNP
jgi:hypothetical protein